MKEAISRESILDSITCELFGIPLDSQMVKIQDFVVEELKRRGYKNIHKRGWSMILFNHGHFRYAIWIEEEKYMMYGISEDLENKLPKERTGFFNDYLLRGNLDFLHQFLNLVDSGHWNWIIEIRTEVALLINKYGYDRFYKITNHIEF